MLRILLIDDSVDDRILAIHHLQRAFPECIVDEVGHPEGFEQALQLGQFDLVITDYQLRWSDGLTILQVVKSHYPSCPVVMLTNSGSEEIAVAGMKAGLSDYVLKGRRLDRLAIAVRESLAKAQLRQQYEDALQQLRLSEARYRMVSELTSDFAYAYQVREDRSFVREWMTDAFTRITGYTLAEVDNRGGMQSLVHPEDQTILQQHLERLVAGESDRCEFRIITKGGEVCWLRNFGRPVQDAATQRIHLIYGAAQDITERKQAELTLQQQANELSEANRLKDEFLATLSHELRTPLNAIVGWSQLLRSRKLSDEMLQSALETIERNAKLQTQLVEDILDVSRIIRGKLQLKLYPINLVSIVRAAIESVQPTIDVKAIQLNTALNEDTGLVLADPNRMQQVIWNLLTNAIKFTPEQGKIDIQLSRVDNFAQITVSDTGIGIEPNFLPYIFDRFSQADSSTTRAYRGLGLGLAIVRHLIEMHNGAISVESEGLGKGATFTVRLPLADTIQTNPIDAKLQPVDTSKALHPSQTLSGLSILLVDDEQDALDLLSTSLEQQGATITAVSTVAQALNAVTSIKPDLIVSDIGMPDVDGYNFMQSLRAYPPEQGGNVPAIALTAYARAEDKRRVLAAGYQAHVPKPVEIAELVAAIIGLTADKTDR